MIQLPPEFVSSPAFLELPALEPPPGVVPNFVDPPNLSAPGLAVVQLTLATIAVAMRLYTKKFVVKRMFAEDWWLLAAWVAFVGFHVNVFITEALPLGVHQWDMNIKHAMKTSKIFHISTAVYAIVMLPLKVAIILQIRRIVLPRTSSQLTPSRSRLFLRWIVDLFLAMNVLFYVGMVIFQFSACIPLRKVWDFRVPGSCVPHHLAVHIVSGAINTASDLITMILPQPVVWKLRLERRRKWGLSAVFLLGGLACMASCLRLYYAVLLSRAEDMTYAAALMSKCIEPEFMFGFLACCLPVLPSFIKDVARRTAAGRRMRGLWTSSPLSENPGSGPGAKGTTGASRVGAKGSMASQSGMIVKKVEMDIEFVELTAPEKGEGEGGRRSSSFGGSSVGKGGGEVEHERAGTGRREEWQEGAGVRIPRPTHVLSN